MARFFKVKQEYDQYPCADYDIIALFAGELFTKEELVAHQIPLKCVDAVDIPEESTFWSFGSRFEC